jgi:alpha-ketoglutarate-dependent taurine dioxygenase
MKRPLGFHGSAPETIVHSFTRHEAIRSASNSDAFTDGFVRDLAAHGVCVVKGTDASTDADIVRLARLLGTTNLGITREMSGPLVMDIRYDSSKAAAGQRPSYFSRDKFPLHTDLSYVPSPPRFLLTQCVDPGTGLDGAALLADCSAAWTALAPSFQKVLTEPLFTFPYPPNCEQGHSAALAICTTTNGMRRWRFRPDGMTYPFGASDAVYRFQRALEAITVEHQFLAGDLLVVENSRVAHGRTAFSSADSAQRHLRRVYAHDH